MMGWVKQYIIKNFTNFTFFYSVLRERIVIVILLAVLAGILDSLGLTMFLPLLQMADGSNNVDLGNLSFITDFLSFMGIKLTMLKALLILVFVFGLKGIVVYYSGLYKVLTQQTLTKKIRMNIVNEFTHYPYSKFVTTDVGRIQNIFLGEMGRLYNTYTSYVSMIQGAIMIVVYMVFSFVVDWKFALLVCVGGYLSNLLFNRLNTLTKERSANISKVNDSFANILVQYVTNFKYLKATGKIEEYRDKVEESIDDVQYQNLKISTLTNKINAFREPMLILIIALVIGIQVWLIGARISAIMVSLLFFYRALIGIVSVQASYNQTISNQGAIDNIMTFYNHLRSSRERKGNKKFGKLQNRIELRNVSYSYGPITVLNNISIQIKKNTSVAFVGESGSGKTTLVNIINGLLRPDEGDLLLDGTSYTEFDAFSYQARIGYISQEPTIFNDTIFSNITFFADNSPENMEAFWKAVDNASLKEFILSLPEQERTILGNNGINLSGGQRQRISIARELFREVDVLILDEATSALDSETEDQIRQSIDKLQGDRTIVMIAHRLSTIKNADCIYFLEKGKVLESGTFEKLLQICVPFKRMVELQKINN